ncbi:MAG TPA: fructosamine kinase family protein [Longimicrobiales bacterium]
MTDRLRARLDAELRAREVDPIADAFPVGGGCISDTLQLRTRAGRRFFLKRPKGTAIPGLFAAEAHALERIASTRTLRVPEVIACSDESASPRADIPADAGSWLLLEWLEPGSADRATWERLGRALADMHRVDDDRFGWIEDNFIGTLPQSNTPSRSWADFWRDRRLRPQLDLALVNAVFTRAEAARFEALLSALDELVGPAVGDRPSLLHGDLWSGNLHVLDAGEPSLIDPAAYFGHREVDLAMAELFGGFDRRFFDAYREAWPIAPGYETRRRPLYQLYYLLVHVNLFGGAYRRSTLEALTAIGF